jgi:DNA-binding CsgD family transcriptional regulator
MAMIAELALRPAPSPTFLHASAAPAMNDAPGLLAADWFATILDQIDYGIVAVDGDARVLHANCAARRVLRGLHPLQIDRQRVFARRGEDQLLVHRAVVEASGRGLRALLTLGDDEGSASVAIVPIQAVGFAGSGPDRGVALLVVGKQAVCEELSAQWFARSHRLTSAEAQVLRQLCGGAQPNEIATLQCVAVSTIRTQIISIRAKTGARNIGALVRQVAALPPLVNALRTLGTDVLALN